MTKKVGKIEIVHGTQILQRVIVIVQSTEAVTRGVQKKNVILKYFAISTGKHYCWSFLLMKLQASNTGVFH